MPVDGWLIFSNRLGNISFHLLSIPSLYLQPEVVIGGVSSILFPKVHFSSGSSNILCKNGISEVRKGFSDDVFVFASTILLSNVTSPIQIKPWSWIQPWDLPCKTLHP